MSLIHLVQRMHFNSTLEKFLPNTHDKPSLSMILAKKILAKSAKTQRY